MRLAPVSVRLWLRMRMRMRRCSSLGGANVAAEGGGASPSLSSSKAATAATKTGAESHPSSRGFLAWYESHLRSRPVPTKMATGGLLWGLGDVVAQVVPALTYGSKAAADDGDGDGDGDGGGGGGIGVGVVGALQMFDFARLIRASVFGCVIHAPIAHVHYNFLEWMTVRAGIVGGVRVPLFKAFMEQFVYWSWFSNSLYHGAMGAMQGHGPHQIYQRVKDVLWETQKAQWAFWIPVQLLNFRYVPVRHQLNVVLVTSVVWTALLSMWYPPAPTSSSSSPYKDNDEKKKAEDEGLLDAK